MASWSFQSSYSASSSYGGQADDEDDVEFTAEDKNSLLNVRDHLLFLVDCSSDMWSACNSSVPTVLKTIVDVYKSKAVAGSSDSLSLVLYGTNKTNANGHTTNTHVMHEFECANANSILEIMRIIEDGRDKFDKEFGIADSNSVKMSNVLWESQKLFSRKKYVGFKRIILLTCNDNPHGVVGDATEVNRRTATVNRFRDLHGHGIHVDVFGLDSGNSKFDYSKFYQTVLPEYEEGEAEREYSFKSYKDNVELAVALRKKQFAKRSLSRTFLKLADGVQIAVSLYALMMEAKKPAHKLADAASLEKIETTAKYVRKDTEDEVKLAKKSDKKSPEKGAETEETPVENIEVTKPKFGFPYGGEKIIFEEEEISDIKGLFPEGIELIGFRPNSFLQIDYNVRSPYFLYPDEIRMLGSTTLFSALLFKMAQREVCGLCRFQPRKGTMSRMVALVPQLEVIGPDGMQEKPPGFVVVVLPYADDIRNLKLTHNEEPVHKENIDLMCDIIKKMELANYHPTQYRNPVLQMHYSVIEALALNLDSAEPWIDTIQPPVARMEKYKDLFERLEEAIVVQREHLHPPVKKKGRSKKQASDSDDEEEVVDKPPKKRVKKSSSRKQVESDIEEEEDELDEFDMEFWQEKYETNKISKCTVAQLKEFLNSQNIKAVGKKADLVQQVEAYFAQTEKN